MKRCILVALCALMLFAPGCAMLLERDYVQLTAHSATPLTDGDPAVLRAENYQELVNGLVYFVAQGMPKGAIRIYNTQDESETALETACLEVVQEDPLGAYAVEFIQYDVTSLVTYCEATVEITYRRTREQVASIVQATGVTAIRSALTAALDEFAPERVLRIGYFDRDTEYIFSLVQEAYYARPDFALGFPETEISIYPDVGRQRIVEIILTYPLPTDQLQARRQALAQRADQMVLGLREAGAGEGDVLSAGQLVLDSATYDPLGGDTAYDALFTHGADAQGLSLALAMLCQRLEIGWELVQGTLNQQPHFWLVTETPQGWRHLDLSRSPDPLALSLDEEMVQQGYAWAEGSVPACT